MLRLSKPDAFVSSCFERCEATNYRPCLHSTLAMWVKPLCCVYIAGLGVTLFLLSLPSGLNLRQSSARRGPYLPQGWLAAVEVCSDTEHMSPEEESSTSQHPVLVPAAVSDFV